MNSDNLSWRRKQQCWKIIIQVVLVIHILTTETVINLGQRNHRNIYAKTETVTFSKTIPRLHIFQLVTLLTTMVFSNIFIQVRVSCVSFFKPPLPMLSAAKWACSWLYRNTESIKVTQKWLKSDSGRPTPKWPKIDSKVTPHRKGEAMKTMKTMNLHRLHRFHFIASSLQNPIFESLLSHLGSLWGGTFEFLLGHFNSFCVSIELGARPLCPWLLQTAWLTVGSAIYTSPEALWAQNPQKVSKRSSQAVQPEVQKKCRKSPQNQNLFREASTLIFEIRSCAARSDLKNRHKISRKCLILRSALAMQDRILTIRVLASLGGLRLNCGLQSAAIRIAIGSQRFQIARFKSQGQKPSESLLRFYYFSLLRYVSNRAVFIH